MMLETVQGGGLDIEEPDWSLLIPNQGRTKADSNRPWRDYAHREWLRITAELRDAGTLAPTNRHMIQRLIIAYIRYDRASTMVFRGGLVAKAPQSGVAKLQIEHSELRQADADATTAEMELGITPRRRGSVTKAKRTEKVQRNSDRWLSTTVEFGGQVACRCGAVSNDRSWRRLDAGVARLTKPGRIRASGRRAVAGG